MVTLLKLEQGPSLFDKSQSAECCYSATSCPEKDEEFHIYSRLHHIVFSKYIVDFIIGAYRLTSSSLTVSSSSHNSCSLAALTFSFKTRASKCYFLFSQGHHCACKQIKEQHVHHLTISCFPTGVILCADPVLSITLASTLHNMDHFDQQDRCNSKMIQIVIATLLIIQFVVQIS